MISKWTTRLQLHKFVSKNNFEKCHEQVLKEEKLEDELWIVIKNCEVFRKWIHEFSINVLSFP